jgi:hypothetical protein
MPVHQQRLNKAQICYDQYNSIGVNCQFDVVNPTLFTTNTQSFSVIYPTLVYRDAQAHGRLLRISERKLQLIEIINHQAVSRQDHWPYAN